MKRMFFDNAQAFTAAQLQPLSSLVPDSHIMFGSDWPATRHLYAADNVETMPFLKGSLPNLKAGDPEPTVDEIYSRPRANRSRAGQRPPPVPEAEGAYTPQPARAEPRPHAKPAACCLLPADGPRAAGGALRKDQRQPTEGPPTEIDVARPGEHGPQDGKSVPHLLGGGVGAGTSVEKGITVPR